MTNCKVPFKFECIYTYTVTKKKKTVTIYNCYKCYQQSNLINRYFPGDRMF